MTEVAVVGLGLLGGSLGLALRERGLARVIAVDRREVLDEGRAVEAADERWTSDDPRLDERLRAVDLIALATPVSAIVRELPRFITLGPVVTDLGSTKRAVVAAAAGASHFVPGHPMAGAERGGLAHARGDLFEGRRWFLLHEGVDAAAFERVAAVLRGVGALPTPIDAASHDASVALTSHAVQLVASAFVVTAAKRGVAAAAKGPGWSDATRVAGGPTAVWRDILETNRDEVEAALRALRAELDGLLTGSELDVERALALLDRARRAADGG
jgi:prephenate dehydrogenase